MQTTVLCVQQKMTVRALRTTQSKTSSTCENVHRLAEMENSGWLMFADIFQVYPMENTNGKIQKQRMKCMHIGLFRNKLFTAKEI
jgi:hypothetical protein